MGSLGAAFPEVIALAITFNPPIQLFAFLFSSHVAIGRPEIRRCHFGMRWPSGALPSIGVGRMLDILRKSIE